MHLTRICLSPLPHFCASSGGRAFWIKLAVGPSLTGTAKCFSSFAPAEAWVGDGARVFAESAAGITMGFWQAGQLIVLPAMFASASSCCLHDGHTNITSIAPPTSWVFDCPIFSRRAGKWRAEKLAMFYAKTAFTTLP